MSRRREHQQRSIRELAGNAAILGGCLVLIALVGALSAEQPVMAVGLTLVVLGIGITLKQPAWLPLLAMPCIVVGARVGGEGLDLSVSDMVLGLAFWPAVLLVRERLSAPMRRLLWANALYQAATLFTVVANPYPENAVEWFHAWLLISGALRRSTQSGERSSVVRRARGSRRPRPSAAGINRRPASRARSGSSGRPSNGRRHQRSVPWR